MSPFFVPGPNLQQICNSAAIRLHLQRLRIVERCQLHKAARHLHGAMMLNPGSVVCQCDDKASRKSDGPPFPLCANTRGESHSEFSSSFCRSPILHDFGVASAHPDNALARLRNGNKSGTHSGAFSRFATCARRPQDFAQQTGSPVDGCAGTPKPA
mgnify:CR=1 FL=1